ncbi:hypothetical protein Tco_0768820 [Tanacetum coccineum]
MQLVAPPSPNYVPGPEHPPSPDYVTGPKHPPSLVDVPYVPEPEYPEYFAPSDSEAPLEDQPLPAEASPTALSPGYVTDSDPNEDPEEDPEEDHTDYPADGGDGDDTNDEELFEDEDDDEEEEEHLAPADSSAIPIVDPVPSARDTKAFETDESVPTPRSPQTKVPFGQTPLRRARKTVRLELPMSASMEAHIVEHATAPTPPLPLGSDEIYIPPLYFHLLTNRTDIPRLEMQPRRDLALLLAHNSVMEMGYGIIDTWDEIVEAMLEVAPTTLEGVNQRVKELSTTVRQENEESRAMYARIALTSSEDRSRAIVAHVRILEAQVATLIAQTSSL